MSIKRFQPKFVLSNTQKPKDIQFTMTENQEEQKISYYITKLLKYFRMNQLS